MADNIYLVMARFYGDFGIPYEIPVIAIDNESSARKIENILKDFCKKYNPKNNDIPFTDFKDHWSEIYEKLDKFLDNADIEIFKERINTVCDNPYIYALHDTFFTENLFEIQCTTDIVTKPQLRHAIEKFLADNNIQKNSGIHEFFESSHRMSLGVSFENTDTDSDIYIYNIFLNGEYVNINAHGTADNPVNNAVLTELVTKWNNFVHNI